MAQAYRSRKSSSGDAESGQITVSGTYSMDEKVVVEWERVISPGQLHDVVSRLPARSYSRSELRFFISGYLRETESELPDTKISDYRISGNSLNEILNLLEAENLLHPRDEGRTRSWLPVAN